MSTYSPYSQANTPWPDIAVVLRRTLIGRMLTCGYNSNLGLIHTYSVCHTLLAQTLGMLHVRREQHNRPKCRHQGCNDDHRHMSTYRPNLQVSTPQPQAQVLASES